MDCFALTAISQGSQAESAPPAQAPASRTWMALLTTRCMETGCPTSRCAGSAEAAAAGGHTTLGAHKHGPSVTVVAPC